MPFGYCGRVLRVDLSDKSITIEEPDGNFYRRYLGGRGFVSYYLLKELAAGVEPLSPENKLIFACGAVTGCAVGGTGRNSVGARSPLTGGYGDAEVGGFWGAELKRAGYDAIIFEGKAAKPTYLWISDGKVELRDASHLWGKTVGECHRFLRELGDPGVRTAIIGLAGEKLVRYACILNDVTHAAGRTGMGAVMGSKNLKAIAVRGHQPLKVADPETISSLAKWLRDNVMRLAGGLHDQGTARVLWSLNAAGALPTRNFREGVFDGVGKINGRTMRDTILVARRSCWACPIRCKREVSVKEPYHVEPLYGGPEYETLASLGSNCGVSDLEAIAKGNELCHAYGLDTISCGASIAFAMECFENGHLTEKETDGLRLAFGNAEAMVRLVEMIGKREGIGFTLGEGVARAAKAIGRGAEKYALHIKGQEVPMHEPRYKQGMGLGYVMSPTGADHCHNIHDSIFTADGPNMDEVKALGILEPLPVDDLSPAKVRMVAYYIHWRHLLDCLVFCQFVPLNLDQVTDLVKAVTGWNTNAWELMKVGERCAHMTRAFNIREGFSRSDDAMPGRFFTPLPSSPLRGVSIDPERLAQAKETYYAMMSWDGPQGVPRREKLEELGIGWVSDKLSGQSS